eukprot:9967141-Lingulodinium_polyedra.AAC.1
MRAVLLEFVRGATFVPPGRRCAAGCRVPRCLVPGRVCSRAKASRWKRCAPTRTTGELQPNRMRKPRHARCSSQEGRVTNGRMVIGATEVWFGRQGAMVGCQLAGCPRPWFRPGDVVLSGALEASDKASDTINPQEARGGKGGVPSEEPTVAAPAVAEPAEEPIAAPGAGSDVVGVVSLPERLGAEPGASDPVVRQ